MARGKLRFKERDLRRALRAAEKERIPMQRVEIDAAGSIILIPKAPGQRSKDEANEWDTVR
jgi:hypothetical protein